MLLTLSLLLTALNLSYPGVHVIDLLVPEAVVAASCSTLAERNNNAGIIGRKRASQNLTSANNAAHFFLEMDRSARSLECTSSMRF